MVDGDQLNIVVDPVFISVAERNLKKYNVIPLFYDANKADPEIISYESLYRGLKRAHDYSSGGITSIGQISNMLCKLWNKENPDRIAAAWLTMFNNLTIDAAKSGILSHYNQYPAIKKRINKATGGERSLLPSWFAYSKNGRRKSKKNKKYQPPNNSTMNRICNAFADIKKATGYMSNIVPFNWEMLLFEPYKESGDEIFKLFCKIDNTNFTNIIESQDLNYETDRERKAGYDRIEQMIRTQMIEKYGSLEATYPQIVKHLFAGKGITRSGHKKMFWRVYGQIALEAILKNLQNYTECSNCGMKLPAWSSEHTCPTNIKGFITCLDCGKVVPRINSHQKRCEACQQTYREETERDRKVSTYKKNKEERKQSTISLVSRFNET